MALDLPTLPSAVDLSTACFSSVFLSECNLGLANPGTLALWLVVSLYCMGPKATE